MSKKCRILKDLILTNVVHKIIEVLNLRYIDKNRVAVVRNLDSSSYAYARIYALPRPIAIAFDLSPTYVIEVIDHRFSILSCREKVRILIHELMHIPTTFSGALRPHNNKYFNSKYLDKLTNKVLKAYPSICHDLTNSIKIIHTKNIHS